MWVSHVEGGSQAGRRVNAVPLQPISLFNITRMFGGTLPRDRASLVVREPLEVAQREIVLTFPKPQQPRTKGTVITKAAKAVRDNRTNEPHGGVLFGRKGR
jgi:hypothetical protein